MNETKCIKNCTKARMTRSEVLEETLKYDPILDKIRAEIEKQEKWLVCAGYNAYNVDIAFNSIKKVLKESEEY